MMAALYRYLFYGLLIAAPVLLGSNRPIFWGTNGLLTALCLTAFVVSEWPARRYSRMDWRLPLSMGGALALALAWMAFQASSLTPPSLHHPIWEMAGGAPVEGGAISIDPPQTWAAFAWTATLAIGLVAVRLGTSPRHRAFVLELMVWVATSVATFGIVVEVLGLGTVGLLPKDAYRGWVTGTFVGRNTAASFFSIGMIVAATLAVHAIESTEPVPSPRSGDRRRSLRLARQFSCPIAAVILFAALVLTGSRAGVLSGIIGCVAALVLSLGRRQSKLMLAPRAVLASGVPAVLAAGAAIFWVFSARSDPTFGSGLRLHLYGEAGEAILDRPLLGHGAGAYSALEPLYHSPHVTSDFVWNHAHSTYLESLASLGMPLTLILMGCAVHIAVQFCKAWRTGEGDATTITAALGAMVAASLHALVDFTAEIQAVAIYLVTLMGVATGETMMLAAGDSRPGDPSTRRLPG